MCCRGQGKDGIGMHSVESVSTFIAHKYKIQSIRKKNTNKQTIENARDGMHSVENEAIFMKHTQ